MALVLGFTVGTPAPARAEDSVTIPDADFAHCIADALGRDPTTASFTAVELAGISWLDCRADVKTVSGANHLTSLTNLNLSGNQSLTDIGPLTGLVDLQVLNLDYTAVSDIRPLAGLTNLEELSLHDNLSTVNKGARDISPLAGLVKMRKLNLAGNQITSVAPLTGLTNLTHLYLTYNAISDLRPLSELTRIVSSAFDIQWPRLSVTVGNTVPLFDVDGTTPKLQSLAAAKLSGLEVHRGRLIAIQAGTYSLSFDGRVLGGWQGDLGLTVISKATTASKVRASATKSTERHSKQGSVKVVVTAPHITRPTGKLIVVDLAEDDDDPPLAVAHLTAKSKGKATMKLPKLKKGKHRLSIIYSGTAQIKSATKTITVKVR